MYIFREKSKLGEYKIFIGDMVDYFCCYWRNQFREKGSIIFPTIQYFQICSFGRNVPGKTDPMDGVVGVAEKVRFRLGQ